MSKEQTDQPVEEKNPHHNSLSLSSLRLLFSHKASPGIVVMLFVGILLGSATIGLASPVTLSLSRPYKAVLAATNTTCSLFQSFFGICNTQPPQGSNEIVQENSLRGNTDWDITKYAANTTNTNTLQGYAWTTSAKAGDTVTISASCGQTGQTAYHADVYRLGWYNGAGARKLTSLYSLPCVYYPNPSVDPKTGLNPANWPKAFSFQVGNTWITGEYLVRLTADISGDQSFIPFVVRNDSYTSPLIFISETNTAQAYNLFLGEDFYHDNSNSTSLPGRAFKISFDRPYASGGGSEMLLWEYQLVRFIEKNGYDVSYATDTDLDANANLVLNRKGIIIPGHSEYWSKPMRDHVDYAISKGVSLAVLGGNAVYRQVRFENGNQPGSSNTTRRVVVSYDQPASLDPLFNPNDTSTWPNTALQERKNPGPNRPEQSTIGSMWSGQAGSSSTQNQYDVKIALTPNTNWIFQGATQNGLQIQNGGLIKQMLFLEYNKVYTNLPTTGIMIVGSANPINLNNNQVDTANMTLTTAPSGALVFDVGMQSWPWIIDSYKPPYKSINVVIPNETRKNAQMITVNVLNKFLGKSSATPITPTVTPIQPTTAGQPNSVDVTTQPTSAPTPSSTSTGVGTGAQPAGVNIQ